MAHKKYRCHLVSNVTCRYDQPCCECEFAPKLAEAAPSASTNSDYATALRVWREWDEMPFDGWPEDIPDFDEYCKERLNSEEPNCA